MKKEDKISRFFRSPEEAEASAIAEQLKRLVPLVVSPTGKPLSKNRTLFTTGELVTLKESTFKVVYLNDSTLVLEPVTLEDSIGILEEAKEP